MKRSMFTLAGGAFIVLLILSPINQNPVSAEEISEKDDCFVDMDGDGFNDNSYDFENDRFREKNSMRQKDTESETESDSKDFVMVDFGKNPYLSSSLSKSGRFRLVKISAKGLDNCRGESDSNFGGNVGGVGGSGQAGGCAGGVCIAN